MLKGDNEQIDTTVLAKVGVDVNGARKSKALQLLATHHVNIDVNSPEAKRVLRKIDMRIMPMVFAIYLLQLMVRRSSLRSSSLLSTCMANRHPHYRTRTVCHSQQ
jgi:hypothetical protein